MLGYQMHSLLQDSEEYKHMIKQLDQLPKTITNNIDSDKVTVGVRGGEVEYFPSTGNNIGAMLFEHEAFPEKYEVNVHTVNFSKDRDTLQIGGTEYNARIRRMVKDRLDCFTLVTNKSDPKSPLFVPYKENAFLVLEPLA